jgi:hypothetical protein
MKLIKKIEEKLQTFNSTSLLISLQEINLYDYLVYYFRIIRSRYRFLKLLHYYDILPLKYFYLEIKSNCFQMHYLLEYIILFINKKYNNAKNSLFFKKGDWLKEGGKSNIKAITLKKV